MSAASPRTLLAMTALIVALAAQEATASNPTFGRPAPMIQGIGFEMGVRVGPQGVIYSHVPGTLSSAHSWIWRSLDGGKTFKWVAGAASLTGKLPTCVGGGDTEVAVDTAGHVYFNDLTLANFSVARSDDGGRTWTPPNCVSTETTPNDRQWYATDGDPTAGGNLYLTYNIVGADPSVCPTPGGNLVANNVLVLARSPAGGLGGTAGVAFAPSKLISAACQEAIMGNVEVSPVSHRIFIIHDDAALSAIRIARCEAVPFTTDPTGLSCVDLPVASFSGFKTGGNFPTMAIDRAGSLYAVWEAAPIDGSGNVTGDTLLYWSSSTNEGDTWTPPVQVPTPGLRNNVFAWAAAGDTGRVGIAWYGTPSGSTGAGGCQGPDGVNGYWSVFYTQTLNGADLAPAFTPPILASEAPIHRGATWTLIGNQCAADRTSTGDFLQLRVGSQGEAIIAYSDARSIIGDVVGHGMIVRQNGGSSLLASAPVVNGEPALTNSASDPAGDATFEANGMIGHDQPNLDILSSSVTRPNPGTIRVTMVVADLRSLAPDPTTGNTDTTLVWSTQWKAASSTDSTAGRTFHAYMESTNGGTPRFLDGQNAVEVVGGGVMMTYPGSNVITGSFTATAPGTITIDVPVSHVTPAGAVDDRLYSVTASAMTLPAPADSVPSLGGVGGVLFNLVDAAPAYDFIPGNTPLAVDDDAATPLNTPVVIAVLANDSDPDGDPLTVTSVSDPPNGSAVRNADDTATYTPDTGFIGIDSFTYTIGDGQGGSDMATVTVTVNENCVLVDDSNQAVEYKHGWHKKSDAQASNGGYHQRNGQNNGGSTPTARVVFNATSITYVYVKTPAAGIADVYIDGVLRETVSYASGTNAATFGHRKTYSGLTLADHEFKLAHRSGVVTVDGFEFGCAGSGADPSAAESGSVTSISTASSGEGPVIERTVSVGSLDRDVSVVVEGSAVPLTVRLLDPAGNVIATGEALISGLTVSGLDKPVSVPGVYRVQVVNLPGAFTTIEISVARTVAVQ